MKFYYELYALAQERVKELSVKITELEKLLYEKENDFTTSQKHAAIDIARNTLSLNLEIVAKLGKKHE